MYAHYRKIRQEVVTVTPGRHEAYLQLKETEYCLHNGMVGNDVMSVISAQCGFRLGFRSFLPLFLLSTQLGFLQGTYMHTCVHTNIHT